MDLFTPVSSILSQWSMPQIGFGAVADSTGTLTSKLYSTPDTATRTAVVKSDPFLDAVLGRVTNGATGTIPAPGSSSEASGVLPSKTDWMTWAADSVKDRLDLSAGFKLAAWKTESAGIATLLGNTETTAPTYFPTVSSTFRDALTSGMSGLLSNAVSGSAIAEIYTGLLRSKTTSPLFSIWA